CEEEKEDLKHFLLWCPAYSEERKKNLRLQQPYEEEEENIIGKFLFDNIKIEEAKEVIYEFWQIREKERKNKT
ncbi:MAG: hypothetical protein DSY42_01165, partial [Aquifex sp.]